MVMHSDRASWGGASNPFLFILQQFKFAKLISLFYNLQLIFSIICEQLNEPPPAATVGYFKQKRITRLLAVHNLPIKCR